MRPGGGFGLIATNTLAQGDTREVGLDQLTAGEVVLYRAVASEPWPGGANLEMATVWARSGPWAGDRVLDRARVAGITASLTLRSRVEGRAERLKEAAGRSFQGSNVLGMGFMLSPRAAADLIEADPRNADVVRPYLNGEDLNSRPDCSPSRWVIDFRDWPIERARQYDGPFEIVKRLVRPERAKNNDRRRREIWWQFTRPTPDLYRAIAPLERVVVIAQTSRTMMPALVPNESVLSHMLVVLAYEDDARFGVLSSGFHRWWAIARGSTMRTDVRYIPTDCFETFPQPPLTPPIGEAGAALHLHRQALMLDRGEGLTKTYNRVHDPAEHSADIARLRELHVALDRTVAAAYDWPDIDPLAPGTRQEILDRMLELNHERYADEVRRGLHEKPKASRRPPAAAMTLGFSDV